MGKTLGKLQLKGFLWILLIDFCPQVDETLVSSESRIADLVGIVSTELVSEVSNTSVSARGQPVLILRVLE